MITDRVRFTVIEMNTNVILTRDLVTRPPKVAGSLTGPNILQFAIPQSEMYLSASGINFQENGQWIIGEMQIDGEYRIVACTIVKDVKVNPDSGDLEIEAVGFSEYPKGIQWLENWNDIAVDPFEIVQRIYNHIQSFSNANLGISVLPASSGTQMLPGYGFDGAILVFDFFALFIRAIDFVDCGDYISGLARDIPFDYLEEATWVNDFSEVQKVLRLSYPFRGVDQTNMIFRMGENFLKGELADEKDIDWVSDVIIRGWLPGKVYPSRLSNADPTRARKTILEEDARIDSTERAAALAKRKLTRRNTPKYWSKITIDPDHPNAPFGRWQVGDLVRVVGEYPWVGEIDLKHKIISYAYDEESRTMELSLKAEGAFNYDPIDYDPTPEDNPTEDPNLLSNGYFDRNLKGWIARRGTWIRNASLGYETDGSVRIDCNDNGERFESHKVSVIPGETYKVQAAVRWQGMDAPVGTNPEDWFSLQVITYFLGEKLSTINIDHPITLGTTHTWEPLFDTWTCPPGVDQISMQFNVFEIVDDGVAYWDDARILPPGSF